MPDIENDLAYIETEEQIKRLERDIAALYRVALADMREKLDDYFKKFATKDKIWRESVKNGVKTESEYIQWRKSQMLVGKTFEKEVEMLSRDAVNADKIAMNIVKGYTPEAYAENYNYTTYSIEKGLQIDTSFTVYDKQTVERLIRENPKLLPDPSPRGETAQMLRENKDLIWNKQHIQNAISQGVIQGESIPDISRRLASVVDMDKNAAIRNARTMMTGAQNGGRSDSYKRAAEMGIDLRIMWVATLDMRTRHSHRLLDGVTTEVGGKFPNGLKFPGDPNGRPEEIYNCRCTTIAQLAGFERDIQNTTVRNDPDIQGMTYEQWKNSRKEINNPIDLPVKKEKSIRGSYIHEYIEMSKANKLAGK